MKTLILLLFISIPLFADSTDIKRIDDKLKKIHETYDKVDQKIKELQDTKKELEGAYKALVEEKKIAEQKLNEGKK